MRLKKKKAVLKKRLRKFWGNGMNINVVELEGDTLTDTNVGVGATMANEVARQSAIHMRKKYGRWGRSGRMGSVNSVSGPSEQGRGRREWSYVTDTEESDVLSSPRMASLET